MPLREDRAPVYQDRTSAAFAQLAPVLRPHEVHVFTQDFEQRLVWSKRNFSVFPVQDEIDVKLLLR